jgi:hypothetical protein
MPAGVAEGAEKLIATAERTGGVMLAELSQAELCALRAETVSLVCERTTRWWAQLGTARREELGRMALDLMATRGFLRLPPGASAADMYERNQLTNENLGPELAVILAARTSPRPLVTCQVPGMDDLNWCHPRFFGITSSEHRLRALVCEILTERPAGLHGRPTLGTTLRYTLMNPEQTAKMITSWAGVIPQGRRRNRWPTITLIACSGQNALRRESLQVRPDRGTFVMTTNDPDKAASPAVTLDEIGVIMELASALTRMAL